MESLSATGGPRGAWALALRRALLLIVAAALLTAVLAGFARLGIVIGWGPRYFLDHGPLIVLGAFATVIGVERAVALGHPWGLVAPALGAAGALAMLAGLSHGAWALTASTLALVAVNAAIVKRQRAIFTWLMLLGSAVLSFSTVLWMSGAPPYQVVPAWIAFFVLTIASERLELSRLAPTPRWASLVLAVLSVSLAALAVTACFASSLTRPLGVVVALIGGWQLRFDLARRVLRRPGLPAFSASGVLAGATWLLVAGGLLCAEPLPPAGPRYDAVLHAVFVGHVLSMVFVHAPIILPAVARLDVPFTRALYGPLILLHGGLVVRVAGDLVEHSALRQAGAIANALAIAAFAVTVVVARTAVRSIARAAVSPARSDAPARQ